MYIAQPDGREKAGRDESSRALRALDMHEKREVVISEERKPRPARGGPRWPPSRGACGFFRIGAPTGVRALCRASRGLPSRGRPRASRDPEKPTGKGRESLLAGCARVDVLPQHPGVLWRAPRPIRRARARGSTRLVERMPPYVLASCGARPIVDDLGALLDPSRTPADVVA